MKWKEISSKWEFHTAKNMSNVRWKWKPKYVHAYIELSNSSACYSSPPTCHTKWKMENEPRVSLRDYIRIVSVSVFFCSISFDGSAFKWYERTSWRLSKCKMFWGKKLMSFFRACSVEHLWTFFVECLIFNWKNWSFTFNSIKNINRKCAPWKRFNLW